MDDELARIVASTASRVRAELGSLAPLLKAHCHEDEYKILAGGIASAVAEIGLGVIDKIFAMNQKIETEFQVRSDKFDRSYY